MSDNKNERYCACGERLHYADANTRAQVDALVKQHGENIPVVTQDGTFLVPRHFIALHGIKAEDIAAVAEMYEFIRVP